MELFKAIDERYSYRGSFKKGRIPRKDLRKIVQAGLKAPSGKNAQTTEFVIVDDRKLLRAIGSMHNIKAVNEASAMIMCIMDKNPDSVYEGYSFQIEDCSAAVENIFLAITAMGYASVWIDGWLRVEKRAEKIAQLLGIPGTKNIRVMLPLGIASEKYPRKKKKPFKERAWFNKYKLRSK